MVDDYGKEFQAKDITEEYFKCKKWINKNFDSFKKKEVLRVAGVDAKYLGRGTVNSSDITSLKSVCVCTRAHACNASYIHIYVLHVILCM